MWLIHFKIIIIMTINRLILQILCCSFVIVFAKECPDGCVNSYVSPTPNLYCPKGCPIINNTCSNQHNILCNPTGKGTHCPDGCLFNSEERICYSNNKKKICQSTINVECPQNCVYNTTSNKCTPLYSWTICEFVAERNLCPQRCVYDESQDMCVGILKEDMCYPVNTLMCPQGCYAWKNQCVPYLDNIKGLCHYSYYKQCPANCEYSMYELQCVPVSLSDICTPTIQQQCPSGYYFDEKIPYCSRFNKHYVCKLSEDLIQYPRVIANEIKSISCKSPQD